MISEARETRETRVEQSSDESELRLLKRITAGDRDALQELYRAYYYPLLRFIRRITGQLELAEEGVNDVMLVVWNNSASFAGRSRVSTWLMGIAYRKALKLLDASGRWSRRLQAVDFDEWVERREVAVEHGDTEDLRDLLEQALGRLSAEQRAVVELTYFGGYSYEEIAAIVVCPVNTVKTRMFHARRKLKMLLPALGDPHDETTHEAVGTKRI